MKASSLRYIIVGLGSIGRRHMKNLYALGCRNLAAVTQGRCSLDPGDLPPFQAYRDLERALQDGFDVVFVCNPTSLHPSTAVQALMAGCHVFMEKPVSSSREELEEVRTALAVQDKVFFTGFQFRYHPQLLHLKRSVEEGRLGRILHVDIAWGEYLPDWHPWEDYRQSYSARKALGGGVVNTLSHPMDYATWIFGPMEEVNAVTAHLSSLEIDTEDYADIRLKASSGARIRIRLDYYSKPKQHQMTVQGEKGSAFWDNEKGLLSYNTKEGIIVEEALPDGFQRNDLFMEEMRHFLQVLEGSKEGYCDFFQGKRNVEMIHAIKESATTGSNISCKG